MKALTFGSLFSGIGGIDLGLERAGMDCAWQVEIEDYATKVLEKHWPGIPRFRDVRECGKNNLRRVDVIAGGFPCQDISVAGRGAGIHGERSGLWSEFHRIICELRPRFVLVENVSALLGRGIDRVLGDLAASGYDAEWDCIPAAAVGAPHIRDRIFILAYADGERCEKQHFATITNRQRLDSWQAIEGRYQWAVEPGICRVANGIPSRVDRLRGLGNAVVPQVAEFVGAHIVKTSTLPME